MSQTTPSTKSEVKNRLKEAGNIIANCSIMRNQYISANNEITGSCIMYNNYTRFLFDRLMNSKRKEMDRDKFKEMNNIGGTPTMLDYKNIGNRAIALTFIDQQKNKTQIAFDRVGFCVIDDKLQRPYQIKMKVNFDNVTTDYDKEYDDEIKQRVERKYARNDDIGSDIGIDPFSIESKRQMFKIEYGEEYEAQLDNVIDAYATSELSEYDKLLQSIDKSIEEIDDTMESKNFEEVKQSLIEARDRQRARQKAIVNQIMSAKTYRTNVTNIKEDWTTRSMEIKLSKEVEDRIESKYVAKIINKHHLTKGYNPKRVIESWIKIFSEFKQQNMIKEEECRVIIEQLKELHTLNSELSKRHRKNIDIFIMQQIRQNGVDITKMKQIISDNIYKTDSTVSMLGLLTKLWIKSMTKQRAIKDVVKVNLDYTGKIISSDNKIMIIDATNNVRGTFKITAADFNVTTTQIKPDRFIKTILDKSRLLVLDYENMRRAMNLSTSDITALCEYLRTWGITTIAVTKRVEDRPVGPLINVIINEYDHDDIAQLVISKINRTYIVTEDRFAEFKDDFTVCTTHNSIQTRLNEPCQYSYKGGCVLRSLMVSEVGRISLRNIIVKNGRIVSMEIPQELPRYKNNNNRLKYVRMKAVYNVVINRVLETRWPIQWVSPAGPMPATSFQPLGTSLCITQVSINMSQGALCTITNDRQLAYAKAIDSIGTESMIKMRDTLNVTLTITTGKITLIKDDSSVVAQSSALPVDTNIYSEMGVHIISDVFKTSMTTTSKMNMSLLTYRRRAINNILELDGSVLIVTENMIDNKIVLINKDDEYIIAKVEQELVDALQKAALEHMMKNIKSNAEYVYLMPLTTAVKNMVTRQYETETNTEEDNISNCTSIFVNREILGLNKYFATIDPDRPSTQIFATPQETTFVLATLGFEIKPSGTDRQEIMICGEMDEPPYLTSAASTYFYLEWTKLEVEKRAITIDYYVWEEAACKSVNCSAQDIKTIRMACHTNLERMVRDVTADTMTIFRALCQGYKLVTLPTLIRGIKMPWLSLKDDGPPLKYEVIWSLPICSAVSHILVHSDPNKTMMACLICISPPVTHNYIATLLGSTLTLENEYSVAITRQAEEEILAFLPTMCQFEYGQNVLFMAYGTFALGLKIMGIDPIETVVKSFGMLASGQLNCEQIMQITQMESVMVRVPIEKFVISMAKGDNNVVLEKRLKGSQWDKCKDTHYAIVAIARNVKDLDNEQFSIAMTLVQVVIGLNELERHLSDCYMMPVKLSKLTNKKMKELMSEKRCDPLRVKRPCIHDEVMELPYVFHTMIKKNDTESISINYKSQIIKVETYRPQIDRRIMYSENNQVVSQLLPITGRVLLVRFVRKDRRRYRSTRYKHILKALGEMPEIDMEERYIEVNSAEEITVNITKLSKEAYTKKQHIVVHAYDKAGPEFKMLEMKFKHTALVNKYVAISIPDTLLYNSINRYVMRIDNDQEKKEDIMSSQGMEIPTYDELKQPAVRSAGRQEHMTTDGSTKGFPVGLILKLLLVALVLLVAVYFWPFTMGALLLPNMLFQYAFPAKIIGYAKVGWLPKWLGGATFPLFAKRSLFVRIFLWTLNLTWWALLAAAACLMLYLLFSRSDEAK